MRKHRSSAKRRTGAAMVEFAIVSPLLFLFFFTAFEFCRVAMIRHTVDNAVYEAARLAIIPGGTGADATQEAQRILNSLGIDDANIVVTPSNINNATENVTVQITVPLDSNSFVPTNAFVAGKDVVATLTMRREGVRP